VKVLEDGDDGPGPTACQDKPYVIEVSALQGALKVDFLWITKEEEEHRDKGNWGRTAANFHVPTTNSVLVSDFFVLSRFCFIFMGTRWPL